MNPKIKKALKNPYYACELILNKLAPFVSDEHFVKWKYYLNFHKKLDLENPQTFNEKLQWLKLYDRHEERTKMVDKYEAKNYVASIIGEEYIIPTYGVYEHFNEIDFDIMPHQFVIKCTHNSGGLYICKDKNNFNYNKVGKQIEKWLAKNPFWGNREYPYKNVKPRIIVEKYIEEEGESAPNDYKVLCFGGVAKLIEVHHGRFSEQHTQDFFDRDWHQTEVSQGGKDTRSVVPMEKPPCLNEMIEKSEILAKGMRHVRIDWYIIKGHLYFGEITFYDGSGLEAFSTYEDDLLLGSWIDIYEK